ncbi:MULTISPECIES: ABC transporter substrate-binding protein [Enterococcus]|uniref:ABC transporter substrate-binding protein n=1 Tax=Enterococcus TaxID=1350 RepID=UPI0001F0D2E3|nr:ABC transporter substrate-binding protein [Enterococcus faecalis]EFT95517.1 ABC transporter, solute-binding protein [Enterococcus faecalis TX0012]
MKIKKINLVLCCLFSLILVSGCKSKKAETNTKTVKISWRATREGDSMRSLLNQRWISNFEKKHPKIKIKLEPIYASESDYYSKLQLSMSSGKSTPDIVNEDSFILSSDARAGYLLSLDNYLKKWKDWDEYYPSLKIGGQGADGKQYGIPGTTDSRGIWTNTKVLEEAGIPADWSPHSWKDILDAANKIKKSLKDDTIPFAMAVSTTNGESVSMQTFEMLLYGTGEELYNAQKDKWIVGSKGILDSFKFINDIYNIYKVGPSLSVAMNSNYGSVIFNDLITKNKVGMALDGNWDSGNWGPDGISPVKNYEKVIKFNLMPTEYGKKPGFVTMSGGWTWSIPKKSKNHKAAFEVLKAMNSNETTINRTKIEGTLAVRKDVSKNSQYTNKPYIEQSTKALENAYFRPKSDEYPKVSVVIQQLVESVASGAISPEKAANQYSEKIEKIVGNDHVINISEEKK